MSEFGDHIENLFNLPPVEAADSVLKMGGTAEEAQQFATFVGESKSARDVDRKPFIEILKQVPGVDPVLAVCDGKEEDIPAEGWIVDSNIAPGYGGVLRIYRYNQGSLTFGELNDNREKYSEASLPYYLDGFGVHTIAYENPNFPDKDLDPCERIQQAAYTGYRFSSTNIIALENGGRLLDQAESLSMSRGRSMSKFSWKDLDNEMSQRLAPDFPICRVTDSHEKLGAILVGLGAGMGLEQTDIRTLVRTVADKTSEV